MDFTIFFMVLSALMTGTVVILCTYIWEMKMRTAERINKLEGELYQATFNSRIQVSQFNEGDYDREVYRQKVSRLLDMALRES